MNRRSPSVGHDAGAWLPVVGGPCDGQLVRNVGGSAPRVAVLRRPGAPLSALGHDYRWDGRAYRPAQLVAS